MVQFNQCQEKRVNGLEIYQQKLKKNFQKLKNEYSKSKFLKHKNVSNEKSNFNCSNL